MTDTPQWNTLRPKLLESGGSMSATMASTGPAEPTASSAPSAIIASMNAYLRRRQPC